MAMKTFRLKQLFCTSLLRAYYCATGFIRLAECWERCVNLQRESDYSARCTFARVSHSMPVASNLASVLQSIIVTMI